MNVCRESILFFIALESTMQEVYIQGHILVNMSVFTVFESFNLVHQEEKIVSI